MSSLFSMYADALSIPDSVFAAAYDALGDTRRSVLKKWIAQHYLFWGRERTLAQTRTMHWDQGMTTHEGVSPLHWSLFVLGSECSSPAQLLAAVLPALLAGVSHIAVVREENGTPFPDALLAGMELAGQELVLGMDAPTLLEMTDAMYAKNPQGKVCLLGETSVQSALQERLPGNVCLHLGTTGTSAGIWFDSDTAWDLETLAWTLPDTRFYAGGAVPDHSGLPMHAVAGSFETFSARRYDALYLPQPASSVPCPCVFTPGQEGGWLWPGCVPRTFMHTSVCWQSDILQQEEADHDVE